jgi:hypothetical protein
MGVSGCILSCLALSGLVIQGFRLVGHLPSIGDAWVCLPGVQVCAELGHKGELDRANRWQDLARPRLLKWDKRTSTDHAWVHSFKLMARPLQQGVVGPYLIRGTWLPSHFPLEGMGPIGV